MKKLDAKINIFYNEQLKKGRRCTDLFRKKREEKMEGSMLHDRGESCMHLNSHCYL